MQSFRPVTVPNSDAYRFNPNPNNPPSPHYRPNQPNSSQPPNPLQIKPHKHLNSHFIKSKEEQNKPNQVNIPQNNPNFWANSDRNMVNNNPMMQNPSFAQMPDDRKYSIPNQLEDARRTSTGLVYQDSNELKPSQRKSQSIISIRQKITKQPGSSKQYSAYRPLVDYATAQEGRKRSPSPYSLNFNAQQYSINQRMDTSQHKREDRDKISSIPKRDEAINSYSNFANHRQTNFRSPFDELRPKVTTINNDNKYQNQSYNTGYHIERKDSSRQLYRTGAHHRSSSGIDKQTQTTKSVNPSSGFQINKNVYINQRTHTQETKTGNQVPFDHVEKSQIQQKLLVILQKQVDEKTKELADKNRQIWDKSKIIIEKNKNIDVLSCQVRDFKRKVDENDEVMAKKQQQYQQILTLQHQQISQLRQKVAQAEQLLKEKQKSQNKEEYEKKIEEKDTQIDELMGKIQQLSSRISILDQQKTALIKNVHSQRQQKQKREKQLLNLDQKLKIKQQDYKKLQKQAEQLKKQIQTKLCHKASIKTDVQSESQEIKNRIKHLEEQLQQIAKILKQDIYQHDKIVVILKNLIEQSQVAEKLVIKEQKVTEEHHHMKLHQDYVQKKCHQLGRELKRTGNKLMGVTNQAVQSCKLIFQTNQDIVKQNLLQLNLKYQGLVQADSQQKLEN